MEPMPFGQSRRLLARLLAAASLAGLTAAGPALAGDVGVSIQFSQPGVYGRVDIGQYPQPQLILSAPIIAEPPPVAPPIPPEPLYLYVPREHQEHWREHCREYHACGHPVYFVHHDWYRDHVMAEHRGEGYEHGRGHEEREQEHGRGRDRERDRDESDRGR
jgi:hypothetical protein